jgi:methylated-DNA-[protein]-cysteine S-methyltransferase
MSPSPVSTNTVVDTPLGPLALTVLGGKVRAAAFLPPGRGAVRQGTAPGPAERVLEARLRAYFAGRIEALDSVPVEPEGTPFQRAVWEALRRIPAGEVRSYGELARAMGRPSAARAVGGACARNPAALLVPCHRAVGSGGELTGYAFGLERKRWLLAHEGAKGGRIPAAWSASAGPSPSSPRR